MRPAPVLSPSLFMWILLGNGSRECVFRKTANGTLEAQLSELTGITTSCISRPITLNSAMFEPSENDRQIEEAIRGVKALVDGLLKQG